MGRLFSVVVVLAGLTLTLGKTAEAQSVALQVSDVANRPISGAVLTVSGNGSTSSPTDVAGKTQLILPQGTQPGDSVVLVIVKANPKDLIFFSPWHGLAVVPKPQGFIGVVLGIRGDIAALSNETVAASFAVAVAHANDVFSSATHKTPDSLFKYKVIDRVAHEAGFEAGQIDWSIRKAKTEDPNSLVIWDSYLAYYPTPLYGEGTPAKPRHPR